MISFTKRIEVANDTARFQATNHLPSVRNAEAFEASLLNLAKNKDTIIASRRKAITDMLERLRRDVPKKVAIKSGPIHYLSRVVFWSIGYPESEELCTLAEQALQIPLKRRVWGFEKAQRDKATRTARKAIYVARKELEKTQK